MSKYEGTENNKNESSLIKLKKDASSTQLQFSENTNPNDNEKNQQVQCDGIKEIIDESSIVKQLHEHEVVSPVRKQESNKNRHCANMIGSPWPEHHNTNSPEGIDEE